MAALSVKHCHSLSVNGDLDGRATVGPITLPLQSQHC